MFKYLLLLLALGLPVMAQDLPNAPSCSPCEGTPSVYTITFKSEPPLPKPHFITFRKSWEDPPLRTNKQTFKSWPFVLSQVGMVASMIVACRNPQSREDCKSEGPAVGVVFGFDYLSERLLGESIAVGPGIYGTVHYSIAARR